MTKFLQVALNQTNPTFHKGLMKINQISGKTSNDIYFTERLKKTVRSKVTMLGLDPFDTTLQELYYGLREKLKRDELELTKQLRYFAADKVSAEANLVDGLIARLEKSVIDSEVLSVKPYLIKSYLSKYTLKKTLKLLNFRNKESMFKRTPVALIYETAKTREAKQIVSELEHKLKQLTINDLVKTKMIFKKTDSQVFKDFFADFKTATIFINRSIDFKSGELIKFLIELSETINLWLIKNQLVELTKFRSDFSSIYSFTLFDESKNAIEFLDNFISKFNSIDLFNDVIEELNTSEYRNSALLHDSRLLHFNNLDFWADTNYLMSVDGSKKVSFNVRDIVGDILTGTEFAYRSVKNAEVSLRKELISQYLNFSHILEYLGGLVQMSQDSLLKQVFVEG